MVALGLLVIFASGAVGALFSLGYKFNDLRPTTTVLLLALISAISSLLSVAGMAAFGEWGVTRAAFVAGVPQGIAFFVAVYLFVSVTRRNRLNVSWTIIQFSVVVPFFTSLLVYHDHVTLRGAGGVAAIFLAIVLFGRGHQRTSAALDESGRWVIVLLVLSTFSSGVSNTMSKVYTSMDPAAQPFPMMLVANLTVFASSLAVAGFRLMVTTLRRAAINRSPKAPAAGSETAEWTISWRGVAVASWMAVTQLSGNTLLVVALTELPGTIAYPVRIVMNIIGVLFFSRVLFDERLKRVEWAGTFVAVAGVALVASSA